MQIKFLLPVCAALAIAFSSCKKDDSTATEDGELETTFQLSADQGISDNITQDATEVLNEAAVSNNFMGSSFTDGSAQTTGILSCAIVTVSAGAFPKTIVIDFGTGGCTSPNGITRKGVINVTLTDSLRTTGSIATMTFSNYYVMGYKKEGTITWRNTSPAPGSKSWNRTCQNGKITAPNGTYWLHSGAQDIVQTAGVSTPLNLLDDVFSITGNHTITNAAGNTRTGTILTPLQKKTICANIDQGTYKVQGPNHFAIIDFGNGTCDDVATISIDGHPSRTFIL